MSKQDLTKEPTSPPPVSTSSSSAIPTSSNTVDEDETESDVGQNSGNRPNAPPNSPADNMFQQVLTRPNTTWELTSFGHPVDFHNGSFTYADPLTGSFNEPFALTTVAHAYHEQPVRSVFHQHQYGVNEIGNIEYYGTMPVAESEYFAMGLTPPIWSMYDAAGFYIGPSTNYFSAMPWESHMPVQSYQIGGIIQLPLNEPLGDGNLYFVYVPARGSIDELLQSAAPLPENWRP